MNNPSKTVKYFSKTKTACAVIVSCLSGDIMAAGSSQTLATMATSITKTFESVGKLITAGSYIAGLAFAIGAIMKFKAHKDNPTNVPIGTPVGLTFIAAALLFLPSILSVTGNTMFGGEGKTAGPGGTNFSAGK